MFYKFVRYAQYIFIYLCSNIRVLCECVMLFCVLWFFIYSFIKTDFINKTQLFWKNACIILLFITKFLYTIAIRVTVKGYILFPPETALPMRAPFLLITDATILTSPVLQTPLSNELLQHANSESTTLRRHYARLSLKMCKEQERTTHSQLKTQWDMIMVYLLN